MSELPIWAQLTSVMLLIVVAAWAIKRQSNYMESIKAPEKTPALGPYASWKDLMADLEGEAHLDDILERLREHGFPEKPVDDEKDKKVKPEPLKLDPFGIEPFFLEPGDELSLKVEPQPFMDPTDLMLVSSYPSLGFSQDGTTSKIIMDDDQLFFEDSKGVKTKIAGGNTEYCDDLVTPKKPELEYNSNKVDIQNFAEACILNPNPKRTEVTIVAPWGSGAEVTFWGSPSMYRFSPQATYQVKKETSLTIKDPPKGSIWIKAHMGEGEFIANETSLA